MRARNGAGRTPMGHPVHREKERERELRRPSIVQRHNVGARKCGRRDPRDGGQEHGRRDQLVS